MNRTIFTTVAVTGIACCAVFVAQGSKNRSLRDGIADEQKAVEALKGELRQVGPLTSLNDVKRPLPDSELPGGGEVETEQVAFSEKSMARIKRVRESIDLLVVDLDETVRSPAEFFRVLPDILRIVQDLNFEEMIEVAMGLDAYLGEGQPDEESLARMVLLLLAAEEDPLRVIQNEKVMADPEIRQSLLGQLAKRDPAAARKWLRESDLSDSEKKEFENLMTFRVMRSDVGAGLKLLREMRESGSSGFGRFSDIPMPVESLPDLQQAYKDPNNLDLRREIGRMVLGASTMHGGIAGAREAAVQLAMEPKELMSYFQRDFRASIEAEPEAALGWIVDALDDEAQQKVIPNAISTWANKDFNAAGEFLGKMKVSKARDMAIEKFAGTVAPIDPEAAAVWTLEIADEERRRNALMFVTAQWRAGNHEAAVQWLGDNGFDQMGREVE